jgi:1,4-dihydroxy-2-naphthoyl-CoA hydrolase
VQHEYLETFLKAIWFNDQRPSIVHWPRENTLAEHLGMELVEIGDDFLRGRMPVDDRHRQPFGALHGGASVALAETLMSYAANLCLDPARKYGVGLEINANHVRSVHDGWVTGTARPVHLGATTQVWTCEIRDSRDGTVCTSRMTIAVLDRKPDTAALS